MPGWGGMFWGAEYWGQAFARLQSGDVECRYVLFIEGLPTAYASDEWGAVTPGSICGTGALSWIGRSETVIAGVESVGARTVKPGLILPDQIEIGGDPKGLGLDRSTTTFKIVDYDDTVAALFATEGTEPDILLEHIAPGLGNLGTSVQAEGPTALGVGTVNPRGKWIGLEKIGPAGQRRQFPAIPYSLVGFDHAGDTNERVPPVPISASPILHAGRMVTLYRIYADATFATNESDRWFTWDEAHSSGDLVWWGTLQDSGVYEGERVWSIECYGPESLLERGLGQMTDPTPWPISTKLKTTATNNQIFIAFSNSDHGLVVDDDGSIYNSADFGNAGQHWFEGRTWATLTSTEKIDLVDEIHVLIQETANGVGTNYNTAAVTYVNWTDSFGTVQVNADNPAGLSHTQGFYLHCIPFPASGTDYNPSYGRMSISMHSSRWEALGFDIQGQNDDGTKYATTADMGDYQIHFRKLTQGALHHPWALAGQGAAVPGDGYWEAVFTTVGVGGDEDFDVDATVEYWRNDGAPRYFFPINSGEDKIIALDLDGKQEVALDTDSSSPFWEPQSTVPRTADAQVNAVDTDAARWFVLKGKMRRKVGEPDEDGERDLDEQEHVAIVDASWVRGSSYGDVQVGSETQPSIFIQHYHDPRLFGYNFAKWNGTWKGTVGGDYPITISPLNCYTLGKGKPIEWAHILFGILLFSTGTSTGWSAPLSEGGVLDLGDNTPGGLTGVGDLELADLGLGVPRALVTSWTNITTEWSKLAGGLNGDLNRMRLCYHGAFEARDAIEAILKPRRLVLGLHGKKYGVYRYEPFSPEDADVVLTEDDCYGAMADPTTVIPRQEIRAHGAIDGAVVEYGTEPGGSAQLTHRQQALDYNARWRRGDLVEELNGRGLIPNEWMRGTKAEGDNWKPLFLTEWGKRAPKFFAKRHFVIDDLVVSRPKGQDIMPGTRVRLSNPWPLAPDGTYGLTNRLGRVIGVRINTRDHSTTCRILVYGDVDFPPHFAPFVFITNINGTTLTYDMTGVFSGYEIDGCDTGKGLQRPDWTTDPDQAIGRLWYQGPTGDWVAGGTGTIVSVSQGAGTITLAAPLSSSPPANTYTMIFMLDDYETNAGRFVHDVYAPITNYAGLYNTPGTDRIGKRWLD